jgi:2-phosphosulfolactate phosphatase
MPTVEICYSPALFQFIPQERKGITVVIDILRATTSFCTAFDNGAKEIIPLDSLELAREYKEKGFLVAAERDGLKPSFADFSNSAFDYMTPDIKGQSIYYTTTNGTAAIELAKQSGRVAIASFINLPAISNWLVEQQENIVLLCAGWKNTYCLEDTLCAAAISERLLSDSRFIPSGDSTTAALLLWESCNQNPEPLIKQSEHYKRLLALGFERVLPYSLQIGISNSIPVVHDNSIIDLARLTSNKN